MSMRLLKHIVFLVCLLPLTIKGQGRVTYFSATNLKDSVRLNFSISTGPGCSGWQVLHGSDSVNLNPIYVYGGLCGNTSYAESYKYLDMTPNKTSTNYYQIYIPPNDYSKRIKVDLGTNFSNLLIFPQPVQDYLNISISNKLNFSYEMHIYDRFGRKKGFASGSAADKITLNVSAFDEGVYVFYIFDGNGGIYKGKFLKNANE
jgi:hypothetical protein